MIHLFAVLQTSMSACLTMETVNTLVPTLRAPLAAPVTLAMNWTAMDSTAQVVTQFLLRNRERMEDIVGKKA